MAQIDLELIQQLRKRTGLGMMDCKKALTEADGNLDKAIELLRKKGADVASKRGEKETAEGIVHAYIHPGSKIGVLVEINCETDFVARTDDIKQLAADLSLHIAAMKPLYLAPEQVDPTFLERERDIIKSQLADSRKPAAVINQIIDGKIQKMYSDICLLNQQFIKNDQMTVQELVNSIIARTGEKIVIKRFSRFEIGA